MILHSLTNMEGPKRCQDISCWYSHTGL